MFPAADVALADVIQLQAHPHSFPLTFGQFCLERMDLLEQFLEALAILAVIVQNDLDLLVASGVGLHRRFQLQFVAISGGHCYWHKWLHFLYAVHLPFGDGSMRAHGLRLRLLLDDDGSLQQQRFPGLLPVHRHWRDFDFNCRTAVLAGLIVLPIPRCFLPADRHPEIAVVGLQGVHDLRCLFAERHPSKLLSFEHRILHKSLRQGNADHCRCWVKLSLEGGRRFVVGLDLGQRANGGSDSLEERPLAVLLGVECLDVVRVFSYDEVCEGQAAQGEVLVADGGLQLFQLGGILLEDFELGSRVVAVEEQFLDGSADLIEDGKERIKPSGFLYVSAQERFLAPAMADVPLNCLRFSDAVVAVDKVRQVGEMQSSAVLVLNEPLVRILVLIVLKLDVRVCQQQSQHLSSSSHAPIPQSHRRQFRSDHCLHRNERPFDCAFPLVVRFYLLNGLKVASDPPPKRVVVLLPAKKVSK